jgi:hypothetical protein
MPLLMFLVKKNPKALSSTGCSAASFAMNDVHVQEFFETPTEQVSAFAIGLSRILQQSMRNALYGVVINNLSEKVFTPHDVFASDDLEVKVHLGLTGPNAGEKFHESVSVCMFVIIILTIALIDIHDIL